MTKTYALLLFLLPFLGTAAGFIVGAALTMRLIVRGWL